MKKLLIATLMLGLIFGLTATAKAVVLAPGGAALATGAASPGGTLLTSILGAPFTGVDAGGTVYFTGTLSQWVRQNATGMLFEYQFSNSSGSIINRLSATNFTGFYTDVDVVAGAASMMTRSDASTVAFAPPWLSPGVGPGETSPLFWIQTDALYYGPGGVVVQDGGNARISCYGPAVPEPGSMLLLGMGVLGLAGLRKRMA